MRRLLIVMCSIVLLTACAGSGIEVEFATPTPEVPATTPFVPAEEPVPAPVRTTPIAVAVDPTADPTATPTLQIVLPAPLYFLSNGQIQRLETDGTTLTQLTQESEPITAFDVSPVDARLIYVTGNDLIEANPQYGTRIVKVDGDPVDAQDPESTFTDRISDPHFSPDGRQIAFGMGGVNLIDAGEATTYTTLIASDPYPDPNNPPRSTVRFFTAGPWSPDGDRILVRFSYWPEAGGLSIYDLATDELIDFSTDDPTAAFCCDWAWSHDGEAGFIASDLIAYGTPGLSRVDVTTGDVTALVIGTPAREPSAADPLRLFRAPHHEEGGDLFTFVSIQRSPDAPAVYNMAQVDTETGRLRALRQDSYETNGDILWARDGSGAVLSLVTQPGPLGMAGPLVWVPAEEESEAVKLPGVGEQLRWGPSATQRAVPLTDAEEAADEKEDERAQAEEPTLTARVLLNVRSGPSTAYSIVGELAEGESASITGVSPDGTWWQIAYPAESDERAWVIGDPEFVDVTDGEDVAVVTPPPLPRPVGRIFFSAELGGVPAIFAQSLAPGARPELILEEASQPSLYRDSGRLALRSSRSDLLGIAVLDLATAQLSGVTSHTEDAVPSWDPTGNALVFASTRHSDRRWRIYVVDASGTATARELTFGNDPDWHPNADLIVYKGCDDFGDNCGLWTMDGSGGNRTPLTSDRTDSRPVWTPDGRGVIFMSEARHGNWDVYSVDAGGTTVTRLTDDAALDGLPTVSPDGSRIAFVSNRGGAWGVWVMPVEGGEPQQVIEIGANLPNWLEQGIDWGE